MDAVSDSALPDATGAIVMACTMMASDPRPLDYNLWRPHWSPPFVQSIIADWHRGGANVLFGDFHAARYASAEQRDGGSLYAGYASGACAIRIREMSLASLELPEPGPVANPNPTPVFDTWGAAAARLVSRPAALGVCGVLPIKHAALLCSARGFGARRVRAAGMAVDDPYYRVVPPAILLGPLPPVLRVAPETGGLPTMAQIAALDWQSREDVQFLREQGIPVIGEIDVVPSPDSLRRLFDQCRKFGTDGAYIGILEQHSERGELTPIGRLCQELIRAYRPPPVGRP